MSPDEVMNPTVAYQTALDMQREEHDKRMERLSRQMVYDKEEHEQRMKIMRLKERYWSERLQETLHADNSVDKEISSNVPSVTAVYTQLD